MQEREPNSMHIEQLKSTELEPALYQSEGDESTDPESADEIDEARFDLSSVSTNESLLKTKLIAVLRRRKRYANMLVQVELHD